MVAGRLEIIKDVLEGIEGTFNESLQDEIEIEESQIDLSHSLRRHKLGRGALVIAYSP